MSDLEGQLAVIARKMHQAKAVIETEEATKTTLVMPFIRDVLGFDVFDVQEVIPEFVADVPMKRGEKVDFAIVTNNQVAMIMECKKLNEPLKVENAAQLFRYFHVTTARIAILTNGSEYRFYADLDSPNKMDERPFLELHIDDVDDDELRELEKLTKHRFDIDSVLDAAEELKYVSAAKRYFTEQSKDLSPEFVALVLGAIHNGRITQRVREQVSPLVEKGFKQFLNDQANNRLKAALGADSTPQRNGTGGESRHEVPVADAEPEEESGVVTTAEEIQGHMIIRAILSQKIDPERVTLRDNKTYCSIILDDNNRKPLARLRFNNPTRLRVGIFGPEKSETVHEISRLTDLYHHGKLLLDTATSYD